MAAPLPTLLEALDDPRVWKSWFARGGASWDPWKAFLRVLTGEPLSEAEHVLFEACTGRKSPPNGPYQEAWLICGRRAGKSFILATIAVYTAIFRKWGQYLGPGERGTVLILAADRKQARTLLRYAKGLIQGNAALRDLIERETTEELELKNRISLEIATASFRTTRGYTVIAALLDEVAFWRSEESANPDSEIVDAIRPAMATIPGAFLLGASSPYAKRGLLYQQFKRHFGKDHSPVLVWHAPTRVMNPSVPEQVITDAYERDPQWASAEFGAEFRTDVEAFISREAIEVCIVPGQYELPPVEGTAYSAFVDPSGGSSDAFAIAIAHQEYSTGQAVLDAVRERLPPFSPEQVAEEYSALLRRYRISQVTGDRYGGEWPREQFRKHGIEYVPAEKPKSDLYKELLPALNSGKLDLLDIPKLLVQFCGLERRTARGGRDSIDHAAGGKDDLANAATGALVAVVSQLSGLAVWIKLAS